MRRRLAISLVCGLAAVAAFAPITRSPSAVAQPRPGIRGVVTLVTLGRFPRELADAVEQGIRDELQVEVRRIDDRPLPRSAFYAPRHRYRADRLLEHLHTIVPGARQSTRILAMTSVDISTTKGRVYDWGVFGLGELGGMSCVISLFRLQRNARDAAHLRFRVVTTAVHEVGHTLGLDHCTEPRCLMRDAEGSIRTVDTSTGVLGPECRAELEQRSPIRPAAGVP